MTAPPEPEHNTVNNRTREHVYRPVEVTSIVFAVFVSACSLAVSLISAIQSNHIASQALDVAKQQNDIALGRVREAPTIRVNNFSAEHVRLTRAGDLSQSADVTVENIGTVAISAIRFELVAVGNLTYPITAPSEGYDGPTVFRHENVEFEEQLQPGGFVNVDVRPAIVRYFRMSQFARISRPNDIHRSLVSIIFAARRVGDSLPVEGHQNRADVTLEFVPNFVRSAATSELLSSNNPYRLFPP
ncbi:MAG: hypothetical protein M3N13_05770 [Candidatus Eremiobacteraeota bacterium]|nr:hypothetical protein [Candidatus Eremiobacteraeota bacterium]